MLAKRCKMFMTVKGKLHVMIIILGPGGTRITYLFSRQGQVNEFYEVFFDLMKRGFTYVGPFP